MNKILKRTEVYTLLFVTNAIAMIMELVAARILSPISGSSNLVWTIIISMMLFANAVGNFVGGKLSDKYNLNSLKLILLLVSATSTLIIARIDHRVLSSINSFISERQIRFTLIEIITFLIPCTAIGMLSPVINKAELTESNTVGKKSGWIYTTITIGSLFGTLFGGLILIPRIGCTNILYGIAAFLAIYSVLYVIPTRERIKNEKNISIDKSAFKTLLAMSTVALTLPLSIIFLIQNTTVKGSGTIIIDTSENYIRIYDDVFQGEEVRCFSVGGGYSSANYKDPKRRDELVFEYTKAYNVIFDKYPDANNTLMLGGAGYSYPRYLISHYPEKTIDVVEIDGGITNAAKKHFYLQEFIDEYSDDRLGLYTDDARLYLQKTDKKYDYIMNDCFTGAMPARTLSTLEATQSIKNALTEGGIYATNINKCNSKFFTSEIKTIMTVFKHVWIQPTNPDDATRNWMIIASDYDYGFDSKHITLSDTDIVFTDDMSPVEQFYDDTIDIKYN